MIGAGRISDAFSIHFDNCASMGPEKLMLSTSASAVGPSANNSRTTALAPGFRFHPSDEELVVDYLKHKICGKSFCFDAIAVVDVYKTEPWDLAGKSKLKTRDQEWYFFCALDKKYGNGGRMNRATHSGYWKATGNDREVRHDSCVVGLKKTLVFHHGRAPLGERSNWVMHEYRLAEEELKKCGAQPDPYVLCRIFHKANLAAPTGNRYAPFIEGEWDCKTEVVPGLVLSCQAENGEELKHQGNDAFQEAPSFVVSICQGKLPAKKQYFPAVCKRGTLSETLEYRDVACPPSQEIPAILRHKRKNDFDLNSIDPIVTESSPKKVNNPSSFTTTTAASPDESSSSCLSALVEYSLLESLENKDRARNAVDTTLSLPAESLEFIDSLQEEIYKVSMERETLRLEMLSFQSKAHVLQAQLDSLMNENENLKRVNHTASKICMDTAVSFAI
ncbi:hypothetical protein MLD38_008619 [Melastoma candidum]|uniref:Uncharacterized protein n=1 Tax=Melastoma candidum TaxID=119954 RepID=A0ACB9RZ72_9MYRT|nr:hypothetical protein MLD38_008619 [Melastoma candidum]